MKKQDWKGHYTGSDTKEIEIAKHVHIYMQRNTKTKKLTLIRFNIRYFHIGAFIGRQNYGSTIVLGGFQLFTNKTCFGIGRAPEYKTKVVNYSGSIAKPYARLVLCLFRHVIVGIDCPEWIQNILWKRDVKRWEKEAQDYEEAFGLAETEYYSNQDE